MAGVLGQGDDGALGESALERVGLADADVQDGRTGETIGVERAGGLPAGVVAGRAGQNIVDLDWQSRVGDVDGVQAAPPRVFVTSSPPKPGAIATVTLKESV